MAVAATDPHAHPSEPTSASSSPVAISDADAVMTDKVVIKDFLFLPALIRVRSGQPVTWTNQDTEPHTVFVTGPAGFTSPVLKQGDQFTHTFTTAASIPYICSIHPYMKGGIAVTPA